MAHRVKGEECKCGCWCNNDQQSGVEHFNPECEHSDLARTTQALKYPARNVRGFYTNPKKHLSSRQPRDRKGRFAKEPHKRPTNEHQIQRTPEELQALAEAKAEFDVLESRRREAKKRKPVKINHDEQELDPAA